MPQLEHDGAVIEHDDTGETDLTPVVLLSGLSDARSTWDTLVGELAGRFRVVRLDHRGHGESSHVPGTYTLEHYAADVVAVLENRLVQPAILVGHSLGGVIAHHVARQRPDLVRAIFLEDPPLYFGAAAVMADSVFLSLFSLMRGVLRERRDRGAGIDEYVEGLRSTPAMNGRGTFADMLGEAGTLAMARAMRSLDPEIFTPAIEGSALEASRPDEPVQCPVAVLRADPGLGPAFTAEHEAAFLAVNPHATATLVEGASHLIHAEQPERFRDELLAFLGPL